MLVRRNIVSLDISDHSIAAAVVVCPRYGRPRLVSCGRVVLRAGVVTNGVIKKPEVLTEQIREALAQAEPRPITAKECILALPDSQVFATVFKFPAGLRRDEIRNTIPYVAEEFIPFHNAEIFYDFTTIRVAGGSQEVLYVAVPAQTIESYSTMLANAGLAPISIEFESLSLARSLMTPPATIGKKASTKEPGVFLVDIGARTTNVVVYDQEGIRHLTNIKIAGGQLSRKLSQALSLPAATAEKLKRKVGLHKGTTDQEREVAPVLIKALKPLIDELRKLIAKYQKEFGRPVGRLVLAGGSSLLPGFDEYLASTLRVDVELGNPLESVDDSHGLIKPKSKALIFAQVLGLGLRFSHRYISRGSINLLPTDVGASLIVARFNGGRRWIYVVTLLVVLGVIGCGGWWFQKYGQSSQPLPIIDVPSVPHETTSTVPVIATSTPSIATSTLPLEPQPLGRLKISPVDLGHVNIRKGPGISFEKIGEAPVGAEYSYWQKQHKWFEIQFSTSTRGWVISTYTQEVH